MRHLQSISFDDYILFKNEKFTFEDGVTIVKGENKDSKASNSANAVGKSLIFTSIPMVAYGSSPLAERKNSAKSFLQSSSKVSFDLAVGKDIFTLGQNTKGASVDYFLHKNGKKKIVKTIADKKLEIANAFGVSEEAFYSTVLISIYRPSPLWKGTSSIRYDFFEKTFDLQFYNKIYKELSKSVLKINAKSVAVKELQKEQLRLEETALDDIDYKELKDKYKKSEAVHKKALKKYIKEREKSSKYALYLKLFETLNYPISSLAKSKDKVESLTALCTKLAAERKQTLSDIEIAKASIELENKNKDLVEKLRKIKKKIANSELSKFSFNDLLLQYKKTKKSLSKLKAKKAVYKTIEGDITLYLKHKLATANFKDIDLSKLNVLEKELDTITHNYSNLKKLHKTHICPVCNTHVKKVEKPKLLISELKAKIKRHKLYTLKIKVEKAVGKVEDIDASIQKTEDKLASLKKYLKLIKRYDELQDTLKNSVKSKVLVSNPVEALTSLKAKIKQINTKGEKSFKKLNKYKHDVTVLTQLYKIVNKPPIEVMRLINKFNAKLKKVRESYETIDRQHQSVTISVTKVKTANRDLKAIKKRIKKLSKSLDLLPVYKRLQEACGPKGIRKTFVQSLAANYIKLLNKYSEYIYNEPYKFSAHLNNRNFDILVERNGKPPTDIRYLSGSECHKFLIISGLALRQMLPENKKFSNIIFDEIEVSSSKAEQQTLVNKFLPFITSLVSSVVFITPDSNFNIEGSKTVKVLKKNGNSKILTR
jgi:DNA repair exonuclease SbcCD ATPase subunit